MYRRQIVPFVLAVVLSLAGCSDGSNPLDPRSPAPPHAAVVPAADTDLVLHAVPLRPGVAVDLHLKVFVNPAWPPPVCPSENIILAVPGFAHTAATWRAYANAVFSTRSQQACEVIALDMPGHGGSGLPTGITFGELVLDDYATALLAVLDALNASGNAPATLIGHSQGGIVIQMAQQRLVAAGSSLRQADGVRAVELLAPVPPAEVPWNFVDSGAAAQVLSAFLVLNDPVLGPHASVPAEYWPPLFFSNLSGQIASGAPTPAQVTANGYNAPAPLYASLQLVGAPPFSRPSISAGIFADGYGTRLGVITFEQDQLIRPAEGQALLAHLAGGSSGQKFSTIAGPEAVHDLLISNPLAILQGSLPVLP
ncbi:MAG TPA: alpha/beta hydrolase [Longimicrobiaceae bacterium]